MSTIIVIGIDQDRASNLQKNNHIQKQTSGGKKFFKSVKSFTIENKEPEAQSPVICN